MTTLSNFRKSVPVSTRPGHNPFSSLQQELDKLTNWFNWPNPFKNSMENFENINITPAIDIVDDKDNFKVEIEMPGMGAEDVKVFVDDGLLRTKGEKSTSRQDKDKNYIMREINYGYYEREIALPDSVETNKATASFKKGMLWVTMPKKPGSTQNNKEITVKAVS